MLKRLANNVGYKLVGRPDFSSQFRRYKETVFWLYSSLLIFDRKRTLFATLSGPIGVTLQGGALSFLMVYGSWMEDDRAIAIGGTVFNVREEWSFYISIIITAVALILGSILKFVSDRCITNLSINFSSYCSQRVLSNAVFYTPRKRAGAVEAFPRSLGGRVTGIVGLARGVQSLLQISKPATGLVYGLMVLLYLDPFLTSMVALFVLPVFAAYYFVNYHAAQNEHSYIESRKPAHNRLIGLLETYARAPVIHQSQRNVISEEYDKYPIRNYLDYYAFRVMARPKSALLSDLSISIIASILVGYLGFQALNGEVSWFVFIGYLLFVRLSFISLGGLMSSFTGFARHYPRSRRAFETLAKSASQELDGLTEINAIEVRSRGGKQLCNKNRVTIKPGEITSIVFHVPITRYNLHAYVNALVGVRSAFNRLLLEKAFCVPNALASVPGGSINEIIPIPMQKGGGALLLQEVRKELLDYIPDPDMPLSVEKWKAIPKRLRAKALLCCALIGEHVAVFIDSNIVNAAGKRFFSRIVEAVSDMFVFVCCNTISELGENGGRFVLAVGENNAIDIMTPERAREKYGELHELLASAVSNARIADRDVDDELDD